MNLISKIDLTSRVSVRAVAAGVISSLALMVMFMSLSAGLGLWTNDLNGFLRMDTGLWLYTFIAWGISLYIGAYVSAVASRSTTGRDGNLHGFVTWAASAVFLFAFMFSATDGLIFTDLSHAFYFGAFLCDMIALAAAMAGGANGAKSEMILDDKEKERIRILENQRLKQTYSHP